jgi:predicted RNA-binding Zn ribbon-like protein
MFGAEALALLNTGRPDVPDALDGAWLAASLPAWGIRPPRKVTDDDLEALRTVRSLLRRLAHVVASGRPLSAKDLTDLNDVLGATPVRSTVEREGDRYILDMRPVANGWLQVTIREVTGSFTAMLRADPSRLRICAAPGCGTAFWDETRSRTRTWCDTRTCGNRVRVSRHRQGRS